MREHSLFTRGSVILLVALASGASGQQFEAAYVTSPDVPVPENFGKAVAVDGEWAIATGPIRNRAQVFHRTPQGWLHTQSLRSQDEQFGVNHFGASVDIEGDWAAIGAHSWRNALDERVGAVFLYQLTRGVWQWRQTLKIPTHETDTFFGFSVALSGDVLAIGAPSTKGPPPWTFGTVFIYERRASTWSLAAKFSLTNTDDVNNMHHTALGSSIAAHGDVVVSGAWSWSGAVYVYERGPQGWRRTTLLKDPAPIGVDDFGQSVAVWEDTIVVGDTQDSFINGQYPPGEAYVYERSDTGAWEVVQRLTASDESWGGDSGTRFGGAVAIEKNRITVGASNGKGPTKTSGACYLFLRDPQNGWAATETVKLVSSLPDVTGDLGQSIDISEGFVWAGARGNYHKDEKAFVFEVELGLPFCSPTPNSTGKPARLAITGWSASAEENVVLSARDCPEGRPAVFWMSAEASRGPGHDGSLCLTDPILRVSPVIVTGPGGVAIHPLDFGDPIIGGGLLRGTTWFFQLAYGDGPNGRNFSNAVALTLE